MNCLDWKLHKKLLDAGGLGPMVYYIPARGMSRLSDAYRILELCASGRTVVYGRPGGKRTMMSPGEGIMDYDMLTPERYERADKILNEFWRGKRK